MLSREPWLAAAAITIMATTLSNPQTNQTQCGSRALRWSYVCRKDTQFPLQEDKGSRNHKQLRTIINIPYRRSAGADADKKTREQGR
uniref:Putative secreted protein n=1 Tax=Anopheles triannulatus TaxID=58253 RepID=A0A2M4B7I6_9DIPT